MQSSRTRRGRASLGTLWAAYCVCLVLSGCAHGLFGSSLKSKVASRLQQRFNQGAIPEGVVAREELQRQYQALEYAPAWVSSKGVAQSAMDLLELIDQTPEEGFQLEDYHAAQAKKLVADLQAVPEDQLQTEAVVDRLSEMELVLSDSYFRLAQDLYKGRLDPKVGDPEWFVKDGKADLLAHGLADVEQAGTPTQLIGGMRLVSRDYTKLKDALVRYRGLQAAGGWHHIAGWSSLVPRPKAKVKPGDRDDRRIPALRRRLEITGDVPTPMVTAAAAAESPPAMGPVDEAVLDPALVKALQTFQIRHGLAPDGVLGGETLEELNVSVETRVQQLEATLERMRWLPRPLASRYILVRITDYSLQVYEKDEPKLAMKVVVGQEARRTPSFSAPLRKMVINPNWFVPLKIATRDLLPILQVNPEGLVHKGFRVFKKKRGGMTLVDPLKIPWKKVTADNFPYKIVQAPGPYNSLGEIKFMPPNPFRIFLHGTPKKELFRKQVRTFSSGCIRIEEPIDLAEYVMKGDSDWDRDSLIREILKGTNRSLQLPKKIPLYLMYFTAWVDGNDEVQFRKDIYGRDAILYQALHWSPAKIQWELKRLAASPAQSTDKAVAAPALETKLQPARGPAQAK